MTYVAPALALGMSVAIWGCVVDPGPNFVIPLSLFNADFFYCHVEPEYLFASQTSCGAGQTSDNGNCHFNSSVVSGMVLQQHPPIDCGGGDHPVNDAAGTQATQPGSAANNNYSAASLEMSRNCTTLGMCDAPILLRPSCYPNASCVAHPRQIYDPVATPALPSVIFAWATTP
jgi:hypothetical protein